MIPYRQFLAVSRRIFSRCAHVRGLYPPRVPRVAQARQRCATGCAPACAAWQSTWLTSRLLPRPCSSSIPWSGLCSGVSRRSPESRYHRVRCNRHCLPYRLSCRRGSLAVGWCRVVPLRSQPSHVLFGERRWGWILGVINREVVQGFVINGTHGCG